jgi:hypothetical protein
MLPHVEVVVALAVVDAATLEATMVVMVAKESTPMVAKEATTTTVMVVATTKIMFITVTTTTAVNAPAAESATSLDIFPMSAGKVSMRTLSLRR